MTDLRLQRCRKKRFLLEAAGPLAAAVASRIHSAASWELSCATIRNVRNGLTEVSRLEVSFPFPDCLDERLSSLPLHRCS